MIWVIPIGVLYNTPTDPKRTCFALSHMLYVAHSRYDITVTFFIINNVATGVLSKQVIQVFDFMVLVLNWYNIPPQVLSLTILFIFI